MKAATQPTQREIMRGLFAQQPILRARELREAGVDGKTIARSTMERSTASRAGSTRPPTQTSMPTNRSLKLQNASPMA
jgi:hypothetical protein